MKWLDTLHPEFRSYALEVYRKAKSLADVAGCGIYVASAYRSPERQWELYKRGRKKVGVDWVRVPGGRVVTNAQPDKTPHCATRNGKPSALAIDIALTEERDGKLQWLTDYDVRWSIIPTAVALTAPDKLQSGAFFRTIRDYPHVEWKEWRSLWPEK